MTRAYRRTDDPDEQRTMLYLHYDPVSTTIDFEIDDAKFWMKRDALLTLAGQLVRLLEGEKDD